MDASETDGSTGLEPVRSGLQSILEDMQLNPDHRPVYIHTADLVVVGDNTNIQSSAQDAITVESLKAAIRRANASLRGYRNTTAGVHLERTEVTQIVEWVKNDEPNERLAMLLDQPGAGKTVVMRDVLDRLEAQDLPVLAIKADWLSGISSHQDLADRLGLPLTLEDCAHKLIRDQPFVIILDQLDALSLSLSRDQATLDVMLSAIARLRETPDVRIVASCRAFDLQNDPRLASIKVDKEFRLQPLDDEQVALVLRALGVNAADLLPAHRTLLRVPLHLDIYARIMQGRGGHSAERFGSLQDLYQALWRRIVEGAQVESASRQDRVSDAVYRLVDAMQTSRQTSAPEGVLDDYPGSIRHLQREGFIRQEGSRLFFLHQTLFDYCYARRFVAQGRSIASEVVNGPQGLFERSQMVQVLVDVG